jgi:hypothetical protein
MMNRSNTSVRRRGVPLLQVAIRRFQEKPTAKKLPEEIDVTVFASASPTRPDNRGRQS